MNRKLSITIIFIICVISAVFVVRWSINRFLAEEKATLPKKAFIKTTAKDPALLKQAQDLLKEGKKAEAIKRLEDIVSSEKGSRHAYKSLLILADIYKKDGNLIKAKESYITVTNEYSDYCDYSDVQQKLTELNMSILFSQIPTPQSEIYIVAPGDSLTKIAKKYSTTVELIKRANGLKTDIIRPHQKLKVQKTPFSIIIDKSQSVLTLILGDEVIKTYPVSTGKNNSTPTGTFKIKDKLTDPVWYSTNAIIPPDSPDNILGSRWMGLTTPEPGYGIHGTTEPESIGYQCTEGCVRMRNHEVEELFAITPVGTEVTIID